MKLWFVQLQQQPYISPSLVESYPPIMWRNGVLAFSPNLVRLPAILTLEDIRPPAVDSAADV
jgi:hypothetical protein